MDSPRKKSVFARRVLVVNRDSQYSVMIYILFISSLIIGFNLLASMAVHSLANSGAPFMPLPRARVYVTFGLIGLGGLLVLVASILGGFYLTNRLAGPVWRLNKYMTAALDQGSREKLSFRKGDHFFEIAESYNRLIDLVVRLEAGHSSRDGIGNSPP